MSAIRGFLDLVDPPDTLRNARIENSACGLARETIRISYVLRLVRAELMTSSGRNLIRMVTDAKLTILRFLRKGVGPSDFATEQSIFWSELGGINAACGNCAAGFDLRCIGGSANSRGYCRVSRRPVRLRENVYEAILYTLEKSPDSLVKSDYPRKPGFEEPKE